jgi:hypothetical protein
VGDICSNDTAALENVEHFNYLVSMITNHASFTREIESRMVMAKEAMNRKNTFLQQVGIKFKEGISDVQHLEHSIWAPRKVYQKYLESLKCGAGEGRRRAVGPIV